MKNKIQYFIFFIIIFIIGAVAPGILTRAKYYTNISMQTCLDIAYMIFNITKEDGEPDVYELSKGEEITAKYKLTNKDENNYLNKLDLKYYIKIVDENDVEQNDFDITLEGYTYLKYNIDSEGNIIDENGNIVDINGNTIEERELTEEENIELQSELETIKKGYGPIELAYDGQTFSDIELNFNIRCPESYIGNSNVNLKIKVIGEGISNTNFTYEEEADLTISIVEINNQNNENTQNINNSDNNNIMLNTTNNDINENTENTQNEETEGGINIEEPSTNIDNSENENLNNFENTEDENNSSNLTENIEDESSSGISETENIVSQDTNEII